MGRGESCECRDQGLRGGRCKHIYAATVAKAKSAACAGCGGRLPRKALAEVLEGDGFVLEGERYCRPCARRDGLL